MVSGYCLYSAATALVLSFGGKTCQGFTLDESVGEFVLTNPNMKIPKRGKPIYSINEVCSDPRAAPNPHQTRPHHSLSRRARDV